MGLFFRKSIKIGKYARINLSKHGVGYSIGPKGLKVGKSSTGHSYISGGKDGVYFRENLDKKQSIKGIANKQDIKAINNQALNRKEKTLFKWFILLMVLGLISAAIKNSIILFWVIFGLDCAIFIGVTVSNIIKTVKADGKENALK